MHFCVTYWKYVKSVFASCMKKKLLNNSIEDYVYWNALVNVNDGFLFFTSNNKNNKKSERTFF